MSLNVYEILEQRQHGARSARRNRFPSQRIRRCDLNPHESLVRRLQLQHELQGHGGCVNRLAWNQEGTLLASTSDDWKVMLWDINKPDPLTIINTGHRRNVFGVRFIPGTNDKKLCSGGMDHQVRIHSLEAGSSNVKTLDFYCHTDRVKDVMTSKNDNFLFWSASEDSTCRQFDLRYFHRCADTGDKCKNKIINLKQKVELKGLSVNPLFPMHMAFACSDQYLRVFDRRKLSNSTSMYTGCVEMYTPEHLKGRDCDVSATYIKYSDDGSQLLGTYHSEHIYLFDTTKETENTTSFKMFPGRDPMEGKENVFVKHLHEEGNQAFKDQNYTLAITKYSEAILKAPQSSKLLSNRAAAFIRRGWKSDLHMALADCDSALSLDCDNVKARYRKAKAYQNLEEFEKAMSWIDEAIKLLPEREEFKELRLEVEKQWNAQKEKSSNSEDDVIHYRRRRRARMFDAADDVSGECEDDFESGNKSSASSELKEERSPKTPPTRSKIIERYTGHCNIKTDIKEATFFGNFIVSGSDDGRVFIWEKRTGRIINILEAADDVVVNCCQPNPHYPILASSGIESVIKIWSPTEECAATLSNSDVIMTDNQETLEAGPRSQTFDVSLLAYIRALLANENMQERFSRSHQSDDDDQNDSSNQHTC